MKVLMISVDKRILEKDSTAQKKIAEYANLLGDLRVIVKSENGYPKEICVSEKNLFLYPTNSLNRWFYLFDAFKISFSLAKINKFDWVTAQDAFENGLVAWLIAKYFRIKLQLQVHTDFFSQFFIQESFLNKGRFCLAKFLLPRADRVRVVSERIKRAIISILKIKNDKVFVLPLFVDMEIIKNSLPKFSLREKYSQFDFFVLIASRFEREKNISLALRAFYIVAKKYPRVGLIIVGEGREKNKLKKLADKFGLNEQVIFENWSEDLISYYKTADLFLLTSNYEGFGLTLVEAAVSGCPIVATDVGLIGDILTADSVKICAVGDNICLARNLSFFLENKILTSQFGEKAKKEIAYKLIQKKSDYLAEYKKSYL